MSAKLLEICKQSKVGYLLNEGKAKGVKTLKSNGFTDGTNPHFLVCGDFYAHFNRVMNCWVIGQ